MPPDEYDDIVEGTPEFVRELERKVMQDTMSTTADEARSGQHDDDRPRILNPEDLEALEHAGRPPPPVKPHTEVDPAPDISTAYPAVKLKNYNRKGSGR